MRKGFLACLGLLALMVPLSLNAQTSNTYSATMGQYKTGTDQFMSVVDWPAIQKSLMFLGFGDTGKLNAGYGAMFLPGLYIGAWYQGNVLNNPGTPKETTNISSTLLLNNNVVTGETVTTMKSVTEDQASTDNRANVLLGFGTWGVKLGVIQSSTADKAKYQIDAYGIVDTTATTQWYVQYPSGTWTDLFGASIQPTYGSSGTYQIAIGGQDSTAVTYAADGTTAVAKTNILYTNGQNLTNSLYPILQAGNVVDFGGGLVFKPNLYGRVNFRTNSFAQSYDKNVQAIGSAYPTYESVTEVAMAKSIDVSGNANSVEINPGVDLAVDLPGFSKGDVLTVDAAYGLWMPFYSSSYIDAAGTTATVAGKARDYHSVDYNYNIANTTTTDVRAYQSRTYTGEMSHSISPAVQYMASLSDQLSMSAKLSLPVSLYSYAYSNAGSLVSKSTYTDNVDSTQSYVDTITKTMVGSSSNYSEFSFSPALYGGLQYAVVKDVLILNLGGSVMLPKVYNAVDQRTTPGINTVKEVKTMGDGTVAVDTYSSAIGSNRSESQTVTTDFTGITAAVSGGLNLNLGQDVSLDFLFNSTSGISLANYTMSIQLQIRK